MWCFWGRPPLEAVWLPLGRATRDAWIDLCFCLGEAGCRMGGWGVPHGCGPPQADGAAALEAARRAAACGRDGALGQGWGQVRDGVDVAVAPVARVHVPRTGLHGVAPAALERPARRAFAHTSRHIALDFEGRRWWQELRWTRRCRRSVQCINRCSPSLRVRRKCSEKHGEQGRCSWISKKVDRTIVREGDNRTDHPGVSVVSRPGPFVSQVLGSSWYTASSAATRA